MAGRRLSLVAERHAREAARSVVRDFGLLEPEHIRIEDIAWELGLRVRRGGLSGAAARLTSKGGRGVVRIRDEDADTPRGRFSLGHELGHFILHKDRMRTCSDPDFGNLRTDGNDEAQANVFSSELLMPERMFKVRCDKMEPCFRDIDRVAGQFTVSLTSAALRTVDLHAAAVALALVKRTGIVWCRPGPQFTLRVDRDGPLARSSVAARVLEGGEADGPEVVDLGDWLHVDDLDSDDGVELFEDVVLAPSLGGALVLLHVTGLPDPDDEM